MLRKKKAVVVVTKDVLTQNDYSIIPQTDHVISKVLESVLLPKITNFRTKGFRARAFISGMTYNDDVIDDVTIEL